MVCGSPTSQQRSSCIDPDTPALNILLRYYSPYPLTDAEIPEIPQTSAMAHELKLSTDGIRPHRWSKRLGDILTGAMNKHHWPDPVPLYVCDRCFKYFSEIVGWEVHQVSALFPSSAIN